MRRLGRIGLWALGALLLLPVVLAAVVVAALNTDPGRRFAERQLASLTGGTVVLRGLEGRFPDRLRLAHVEVHDAEGAWLLADDVALDWSPLALLHEQALIRRLEAARLQVPRLPASALAPSSPTQPSPPFSLPVQVTVEQLAIARAEIGAPVIGVPAALSLAGQADVATLDAGAAALTAKRLDGDGSYTLTGQVGADRINADLAVREPAGGLLAHLAGLPDLGALRIDAAVNGPRSALATTLAVAAGPLTANAQGTVNLVDSALALDVTAQAPAMRPAPAVQWKAVALRAHAAGPFTAPDATGTLRIDGLDAGGASIGLLTADLAGNAGRVTLKAVAEALRIPGPQPGLLESAPLRLDATARLDDPARPVQFSLSHPFVLAQGTAKTAGDLAVNVAVKLPDLAPLAKIGGIDLAGHADLALQAAQAGTVTTFKADGTVGVTGGVAPAPALIGPDAKLALAGKLAGSDLTLDSLTLDGKAVSLAASGTYAAVGVDLTAKAALSDLALINPALTGSAALDAHARGPADALALQATLSGDVGAAGIAPAPVRLTADLTGLPGAPAGRVTGEGTLAGAPLRLALDAGRAADGTLRATIDRADWRSLHAEGALTLPAGATLPLGKVALKFANLEDLRPLIGQPVAGSVAATVQLDPGAVVIDADARDAGLPGQRVGRASIKARVADPLGEPSVQATVAAAGINAAGVTGEARVEANGPQAALAVKLTADLGVSGTQAKIASAALLDAPGKRLRLDTLQVTAGNAAIEPQTVRLQAPATISFADGVAVDRLRLGVQQAVLDVAGRLSPTLDATVTLRTPADIAALVAPDYALDGSVSLDARLSGTPAKPGGTVKLAATGIQLRGGPGQALPPANLVATADLQGDKARIDARLNAGSANLAVNGQAPLGAGALNLRATGGLDLAITDPILTAAGRRARGRLTLDATVGGSVSAPEVSGSARLSGAEVQDFAQGLRVTGLNGTFRFEGQTLRIASLTGRAGNGSLSAGGTVGVLAPALPVDLRITMRGARPLSSDLITATLDADLGVGGSVSGGLQVGGRVLVRRAELRIPKTLPASVVTLDVRRAGEVPPPPEKPAAPIGLDLTIDAPNSVFVRGRGVDAELSGSLQVRGTSAAPRVSGGLEMRRGSISVAGTTLNFSRGQVGFDGTGVSGKIDPTLDFVAESSAGGITATLAITGYVSEPKIKLSSVPDLPQDEVLAYLIFKRSAKELGPFQIAEIAAAVAELTGVGGSGGLNPLESVRKGLGLDRLSVGGGSGSDSAPTLEAGRYIANGVYVGAKQGTTGGQTQGQVQIDITKGLKLETDVGTGRGGNQVGLTYEFEY